MKIKRIEKRQEPKKPNKLPVSRKKAVKDVSSHRKHLFKVPKAEVEREVKFPEPKVKVLTEVKHSECKKMGSSKSPRFTKALPKSKKKLLLEAVPMEEPIFLKKPRKTWRQRKEEKELKKLNNYKAKMSIFARALAKQPEFVD